MSSEVCSILGIGFGVCMAVGQKPTFSVISAITFARRLSSLGSKGQTTIAFLFGATFCSSRGMSAPDRNGP